MKKSTFFIIAGLICISAALGLCAYNIWDSIRAERAANEMLNRLLPDIEYGTASENDFSSHVPEDEKQYPDYILDPDMDMPVETIEGIEYVGVLSIPTLELQLPVIREWSYNSLYVSPCVYCGTAYKGNFVICAHNYPAHFGQIKNLGIGDPVEFTDVAGNSFEYKVSEVEILMPDDVEQMISGECNLTLFTCTIGGRSRVTVRCDLCK